MNIEIIETKADVISDNDKVARDVRRLADAHSVFFVNVMSSPGSGKTTTLVKTIQALKSQYRIGVIEADVDSDVDAKTVQEAGAKVIQVHTGGSCHMDANMTRQGLEALGLEDVDVVFLENIGNLVCPAEFDVGADLQVMILSVPEGDDKPLKYPLMFTVSDVMLVNKIDVLPVFDFDFEKAKERARSLNPKIQTFPISSKTSEGFETWISFLKERIEEGMHESH